MHKLLTKENPEIPQIKGGSIVLVPYSVLYHMCDMRNNNYVTMQIAITKPEPLRPRSKEFRHYCI